MAASWKIFTRQLFQVIVTWFLFLLARSTYETTHLGTQVSSSSKSMHSSRAWQSRSVDLINQVRFRQLCTSFPWKWSFRQLGFSRLSLSLASDAPVDLPASTTGANFPTYGSIWGCAKQVSTTPTYRVKLCSKAARLSRIRMLRIHATRVPRPSSCTSLVITTRLRSAVFTGPFRRPCTNCHATDRKPARKRKSSVSIFFTCRNTNRPRGNNPRAGYEPGINLQKTCTVWMCFREIVRAPITVLHEQQWQETGGINVHVVATLMTGWRINDTLLPCDIFFPRKCFLTFNNSG